MIHFAVPAASRIWRVQSRRPGWLAIFIGQLVFLLLPYFTWPQVDGPGLGPQLVEVRDGRTIVSGPYITPVPPFAGRYWLPDFSHTCRRLVQVATILNTGPLALTDLLYRPFHGIFRHPTLAIPLSYAFATTLLFLVAFQWLFLMPLIWKIGRPRGPYHLPLQPLV